MECWKIRFLPWYEPFFPVFEKLDEKFVLVVGKKNFDQNFKLKNYFSQNKELQSKQQSWRFHYNQIKS